MKQATMVFGCMFGIAMAITSFEAQAKKIKCWTNSDGVRECGYSVPPEYSQKGHTKLNSQGVVVGEQSRAKSPEEVAAEQEKQRQRIEAERIAKLKAAKDKILLDTFASEDDMQMALAGKVRAIDLRVKHSKERLSKLNSTKESLEERAAVKERAGEKVPTKLLGQINDVERQINELQAFIAKSHNQKAALQTKFGHDLKRYRELKGS